MKKFLFLWLITIFIFGTACTGSQKIDKIDFDGFYKFKLLTSYEDCIKILKDSNLNYIVNELHDIHGNGIAVKVENIMEINNKKVSLILSFPDTLQMIKKYVQFNSKVLISFAYIVTDIDLDYARSFVKYCSNYFGEPGINQFEIEYAKDFKVKFVSWKNSSYNIYCVTYLDVERVHISFNTTDEQKNIIENIF